MLFEQKILPERITTITEVDFFSDLFPLINQSINVAVDCWDEFKEELIVLIGGKFKGIIPIEEVSVYALSYFEGDPVPKEVLNLLATKSNVSAIITHIDGDKVLLSRRKNMEIAASYFSSIIGHPICAKVLSATNSMLFSDIGAGIIGHLLPKETSVCFVKDMRKYFANSSYISAQIISSSNNFTFRLSYKQNYKRLQFCFKDIVEGKIVSVSKEKDGMFIEFNPATSGIADIESFFNLVDENGDFIVDNKAYKTVALEKTYLFRVKKNSKSKTIRVELI